MNNHNPSSPFFPNSSNDYSLPSQVPPTAPPVSSSTNILPRPNMSGKHCWVCFATDEDDFSACWLSPCRCRGTAKWVHQECLQRWVDEKQQGSSGGSTFTFVFLSISFSF